MREWNHENIPLHMLRPATVGEILDNAVELYRRYFRKFFFILLYYGFVSAALSILMRILFIWGEGQVKELAEMGKDGVDQIDIIVTAINTMTLGASLGGLMYVATVWTFIVMIGAVTYAVWQVLQGKPFTPIGAYKAAFKRWKSLFFATVLTVVTIYAAALAGVVPGYFLLILAAVIQSKALLATVGIAVAVGALLGVVVVLAKVFLTPVVVMIEDKAGLPAILRSATLATHIAESGFKRHPLVRASVLLTVLSAVWVAYGAFIAIPRVVLMYTYQFKDIISNPAGLSSMGSIPLSYDLIITAFTILYTALVMPYLIISLVLFYNDLKMRREGTDLSAPSRG